MQYRRLGKTELMVSEIGLGAEWLERHSAAECTRIIQHCQAAGINILDCWMAEPNVRTNIGNAIAGSRDKWYIQGHIGSTWQNGQYVRTRDLRHVRPAFEDLLARLQTDYIDLGMIHFVDDQEDWDYILQSDYLQYILQLKAEGRIRHIGMSSHNPRIARQAVESGLVEMILFSINPAFDLMPAGADMDGYFTAENQDQTGRIDPERAALYRLCLQQDVGITVMKGYAGGRLFDAARSPFGVALTPVQCLHYCLTRPAVAAVMAGYDTVEHVDAALAYEGADAAQKDYATPLAAAPLRAWRGQCTYCGHCAPCAVHIDIAMVNKLYDLAVMQPTLSASLKAHYESLPETACIACGACAPRCPFGVDIPARMQAAAQLFARPAGSATEL